MGVKGKCRQGNEFRITAQQRRFGKHLLKAVMIRDLIICRIYEKEDKEVGHYFFHLSGIKMFADFFYKINTGNHDMKACNSMKTCELPYFPVRTAFPGPDFQADFYFCACISRNFDTCLDLKWKTPATINFFSSLYPIPQIFAAGYFPVRRLM